jgi:hypothetical protein
MKRAAPMNAGDHPLSRFPGKKRSSGWIGREAANAMPVRRVLSKSVARVRTIRP